MDLVNFIADPSGKNVALEYQSALNVICINSTFMKSSEVTEKLHIIKHKIDENHADTSTWDTSLLKTIKKGFNLIDFSAAKVHQAITPIRDGNDNPFRANLYHSSNLYYNSLSWEKPYLNWVLWNLSTENSTVTSNDDIITEIQIVLGLMCRAANECAARKRSSFSSIINMINVERENSNTKDSSIDRIANIITPSSKLDSNLPIGADCNKINPIDLSIKRVYDAANQFIQSRKDLAAQSTFMIPAVFYCEATNSGVITDLDVHGMSTYLALLLAATGIHTNRIPDLQDEAKGTVNFLAAEMNEAVQLMWSNDNIGKSHHVCLRSNYNNANDSRGETNLRSYYPKRRVPDHQFIWPQRYITSELATLCANNSSNDQPYRLQFARYVNQFCSYFSETNLLPTLITAITGDDAAYGGKTNDIAIVFQYMFQNNMLIYEKSEDAEYFNNKDNWNEWNEDIRYALWDFSDYSAIKLRYSIVKQILQFAGVVKNNENLMSGSVLTSSSDAPSLNDNHALNEQGHRLIEMGFQKNDVIQALSFANDDFDSALNYLLNEL
eukprot:gene10034-13491_t